MFQVPPDKVLAYCLQYGEFLTVKIENMSVQHTELDEKDPNAAEITADAVANDAVALEEVKAAEAKPELAQAAPEAKPTAAEPKKKYGTVAVSNGDGIEALFREFGVDGIIHGGQTNNPSTNDFLNIFPTVNAEHIFVFPNNGNIVMAAQQAGEMYTDAKIHVIPTKNIGTGYVAISTLDYDNPDPDAVAQEMIDAISRVTSGYVSPSIRDADMNGVHITKGDTIGIIEKQITVSEPDRISATCALSYALLTLENKSMLTAFCGVDSTDEDKAALEEFVKKHFPSAELYLVDGGQDIYPFIFIAE